MDRINKQKMYSNYKRDAKFLGIIDYKSLVVIGIYVILIVSIIKIIPISIEARIYSVLFFTIPILSIFCINLNNESTIDVLLIIISFFLNNKIFVRLDYLKDFNPNYYANKHNTSQ